MGQRTATELWIVVLVTRGLPAEIKAFSKLDLAEVYERELRHEINLENDETGIFPIEYYES